MGKRRPTGICAWLRALLPAKQSAPPEIWRAKRLIAAVDRGGIPLDPARVNAIARDLGLEVSRKAPVEETVRRIRDALARAG